MGPPPSDLPVREGDIVEATVMRIEKYGAFCQLENYTRLQGLLHISQLANCKVESVEDVVSANDVVWVKILEIVTDEASNRLRIKLSLKDASQDGSRTDFGKEREVQEDARNELETNLNSMIGMGVARDPMAGRLIMKHENKTFRGGYALVGDDEGEPERSVAEPVLAASKLPPVGRGRGATLPAWMTVKEGPTGAADSDDGDGSQNKKKKHKKHSKSHRKHHKHSKKEKKRKRRRRSPSYDGDEASGSDNEENSRSRRKKRKKDSRQRRSHKSRSNHDSSDNSDSDSKTKQRDRQRMYHGRESNSMEKRNRNESPKGRDRHRNDESRKNDDDTRSRDREKRRYSDSGSSRSSAANEHRQSRRDDHRSNREKDGPN